MLIEAIPNVSEGRRHAAVEAMAHAFTRGADAWLLDTHEDPSLHRSVVTAALEPDALIEASCALLDEAMKLIDLAHHHGVHPRIGALDVLPFVPLDDVSRDDVIELARDAASELAHRFELPVFLYGGAATSARPHALHELRRGGLTALQNRMDEGELVPDFGKKSLHETAGATAVGVRDFLISYNVALETEDVRVAHAIARSVRESSGGLPAVQALGMALPHKNLVQVSMNLTNFSKTSLQEAYEAVRTEATSKQIEIDHSEIVGLIPSEAAFEGMSSKLRLERAPGILEERLKQVGAI